ncbi:hypothetical protein MMYC01_208439 [Madurella mycetomatis]|uniref:VOC domain-containing protein n=1 Tax=Madurella mycetomatis TaxID=100816 RepID=A0A175VZF4_9PEZI|nr:hypothetical protein MMYC01_208439 [Madurella mycetomatis]
MPLGHVSLPTGPSNYKAMRDFYVAALKPLGYTVFLEEEGHVCGFHAHMVPDFWLHCGGEDFAPVNPGLSADENLKARGRTHVAFNVASRGQVEEWYRNAVKAGGIPNGEPGERSYAKGYYAAFVLDPLGNNIEAVYYKPYWLQVASSMPTVLSMLFGAVVSHLVWGYAKRTGWA